jgi:HAD superfamily hydrolase (TIGR01509 family)
MAVIAPRAVLWDLDGTLADSRDYHWRAWRDTMARAGVTITEAQFNASFGQRNDAILTTWLGSGATPDRIRKIGDAKEELYRTLMAREGIVPLPGAAEWVRRLHDEGWRQAIASSAPWPNVELMLQMLRLGDSIDAVVSAEDVRAGKPDPEVFLTAAAKLGVAPECCVVVEDAEAGIEAARRGGMRSIGVGSGPIQAADIAVRSLDELPADAFERLVATRITSDPAGSRPERPQGS